MPRLVITLLIVCFASQVPLLAVDAEQYSCVTVAGASTLEYFGQPWLYSDLRQALKVTADGSGDLGELRTRLLSAGLAVRVVSQISEAELKQVRLSNAVILLGN